MLVGDQAMMVSRVQSWPSLDLGAGDGADPSLMYYPGQCTLPEYPQYPQQMPQTLYQPPPPLAPLYYPHIPPPLSPHFDAAILDIGHANVPAPPLLNPFSVPPPPIHKPQVGTAFTFPETYPTQQHPQETKSQPRGGGCHVCSTSSSGGFSSGSVGNKMQPLTPMTPSYPNQHGFGIPPPNLQGYYNTMTPPPTFYLPPSPVPSTLLSLSGTSVHSTELANSVMPIGSETGKGLQGHCSKQSSTKQVKTPTNYQVFMSPYKRFSKFSGVPTPARFPLKNSTSSSSLQGHGPSLRASIKEEEEDISHWYQAGDRWGHRRARTVSEVSQGFDLNNLIECYLSFADGFQGDFSQGS